MLFFLVLALYIGGVGSLHPRNAFQGSYDMSRLAAASPALRPHIIPASSPRSKSGRATIDFADAAAVRALNQALLKADYGVEGWVLPPDKLCPPVPGRADYVHVLADTLANSAGGSRGIPSGGKVVGLDVGTGSSAIYALIGAASYGWAFIGSECDEISVDSAQRIVDSNPRLDIVVRHQPSQGSVLKGVLKDGETIDFAMCNPPFFASPQEFLAANSRKVRNLAQNAAKRGGAKGQRARPAARASVVAAAGSARRPSSNNFEGDASELWCQGGECAFIEAMAKESQLLKDRCLWFSSLVSRADNLPTLLRTLDALPDLKQRRVVAMAQGQKSSQILLWTFVDDHAKWCSTREWDFA